MTITIPTAELVGLLVDTTPFAFPEDELPSINAVQLHWDGQQLHALATDRYRIAVSTYDQDDPPIEDSQDALGVLWGGADEPWQISIPLHSAEHLIKVFKLPKKRGQVPVVLDNIDGRLKLRRDREPGVDAITVTVDGLMEPFPNVRALLSTCDVAAKTTSIAYNPLFLADFARVRQRGPIEMTFTGDTSPTLVTIGARFEGAIMPIRIGEETGPTFAADAPAA